MISEVKSSAQELNKGLLAFNKDQAEKGALNYLGQIQISIAYFSITFT